jgi:hypothetical protein
MARRRTANFCKYLDWKPLFSTHYGMYKITLNELKAVPKVSAQAGHSGAVESTAQDDDFHEETQEEYL